ncbi:glycosyltransferase 87 family protein [Actinoplanes missouriensis]|uniref:glycosyltransferase 87 family protein n=1 Tax=Actinoplanes missouriensis TaxID=1866 RepID=UPI0033FD85BB
MQPFRNRGIFPEVTLILALVAIAGILRHLGFGLVSGDYEGFLRPWAHFIAANGGFDALAHDFADYNVPYLYVLTALTWLATHSPLGMMVLVKLTSVAFDAVMAYYAGRIVGLRWPDWRIRALAAVSVLLLPTVVLNGAYWAQCDSIYTALTLAGLYHLLRDRPWWGVALLGLSLTVKLQAIFVFPALLTLLLAGRIRWRHLLTIPAVYLLCAVPAWLAGRPFGDLMLIYLHQSGQYGGLTLGAPSIYAYVRPGELLDTIRTAGSLLAVAAVLVVICALLIRRVRFDRTGTVLLFATFSILVPFLLPSMHERYFFQVEVLAVVVAFWLPRELWYVPLLTQAATFAEYQDYLFGTGEVVDLRILALLTGAALVATASRLLRHDREPDPPVPAQAEAPTPAPARVPALT